MTRWMTSSRAMLPHSCSATRTTRPATYRRATSSCGWRSGVQRPRPGFSPTGFTRRSSSQAPITCLSWRCQMPSRIPDRLASASKALNLLRSRRPSLLRSMVRRPPSQHDHAVRLVRLPRRSLHTRRHWLDTLLARLQAEPDPTLGRPRDGAPPGGLDTTPGDIPCLAALHRARARVRARRRPATAFLTQGRVALGRGLGYGHPGAGHVGSVLLDNRLGVVRRRRAARG